MKRDIELCLTLYALSAEYTTGKFSLEDCLAKSHEMGYTCIELVACQMIPEYPHPSTEWIARSQSLLLKQANMLCVKNLWHTIQKLLRR